MVIAEKQIERSLLGKIAQGNHHAFCTLFDHYHGYVYAFSRKLTRSEDQAAELVQDIFLKIWAERERLADLDNFEAYLTSMVRNFSFSYLRRNVVRNRVNEHLRTSAETLDNSLEAALDYREKVDILNQALEKLPEQQRRAYELCHGQGLKYHEAAQQMNLSPETVHYHMKLALKAIREHFRKNAFAYHILFSCLFRK